MSGSSQKPFSRSDARGPTEIYPEWALRPERARRIAERLEVHHTPKHGSWLNMAVIELWVLAWQCLDRRIESAEVLVGEVEAWEMDRNERMVEVKWQFTTADARIKLRRLYPTTQLRWSTSRVIALSMDEEGRMLTGLEWERG